MSWHIAYCTECGEDIACMSEVDREAWAQRHYEETDELHTIRYWTAEQPPLFDDAKEDA